MLVKMQQFPSLKLNVSSLFDFKRRKAAIKEPETVEWLQQCLKTYGTYTLLDIGANVGGYSLIACSLDQHCRALAIEPFPPTFLTLCKNIVSNQFEDRIIPLNGLVGLDDDSSGTAKLKFGAWHSGVADHPATGKNSLLIPSLSSQQLYRYFSKASTIICKIDVDGAEAEVVNALSEFLPDQRLKSVLIECENVLRENIESLMQLGGLRAIKSYDKGNNHQVNLILHRE